MPEPIERPGFADDLRASLEERLRARDRAGAVALALNAVHESRISIADLYTQVLGPVLSAIGSAWQHGTKRVWEEHLASHMVATIVEALYPDVIKAKARVAPLDRSALLACPPAERHEIGLRMLADRFELAGWDVTYLGGDLPLKEIVAAATAVDAQLVVLSVSTVFERVELRCFIDTLRKELPGVRIVVGGPAFALDRDWPAEDLLDTAELGLPGTSREG